MIYRYLLLAISIALIVGCDQIGSTGKDPSDRVLVEIGDQQLHESEIKALFIGQESIDSTTHAQAYIESWIKRNVILSEAINNISDDIDIDGLVEDYRSSLLLHNYRQLLIAEELDTAISDDALQTYYKNHREQFILQQTILKGRVAAISKNKKGLDKFYTFWKDNDSTNISSYLKEHSIFDTDYQNTWTSSDQFSSTLPTEILNKITLDRSGDFRKRHDTLVYFIKIDDAIKENEIAPLSYIEDNIRKVIIHNRKRDILESIERSIYEKYLKSNKIQVYRMQ